MAYDTLRKLQEAFEKHKFEVVIRKGKFIGFRK